MMTTTMCLGSGTWATGVAVLTPGPSISAATPKDAVSQPRSRFMTPSCRVPGVAVPSRGLIRVRARHRGDKLPTAGGRVWSDSGRGLLARELGAVELGVQAAGGEQLVVPAALVDLPVIDDQDLVSLPDGRQAVRYHQ